jgi:serine/threonine protein kinase
MDKIGKYHLLRKLGEGATSEVFLSFDPADEKDVAVKIATAKALHDPQRGHLYRKLFETEAALVGKLNHEHLVAIYDAVVDGDTCYIVMEFVQGGTLEKYTVDDNLLSYERVVDVMYKASRGMGFASKGGIIHRDLKPANILLIGPEEKVKISDWGSAIVAKSGITPIEGIGSPAYMSPEQALQKPLDFRTDIYSMGVVMFQLCTGRLPFRSSKYQEVLQMVVNTPAPAPSDFRVDLPTKLENIIKKAMAKKPEQRYQSWEEFGVDLQGGLGGDTGSWSR